MNADQARSVGSAVLLFVAFSSTTLAAAEPATSPESNSTTPAGSYPPHTIVNSQLRVVTTKHSEQAYQLHIGLPWSYTRNTEKKYPVVYVTDGYWDFEKIVAIREGLINDKVAPEFIVVGLGYTGKKLNHSKLRLHDLSPVRIPNQEESGYAAEFLKTIEEQIIPLVEHDYRADPSYRVLAGASLGGLFTLYAMYTKPGLFDAYIAATPAVVLNDDWILGYEDAFTKSGRQLKGRLYVTVGGNEGANFVSGVLRYNYRVASRMYPDLAYEFRIIDDERHSSMQMESYVRGLRFAFVPLAPETGPSLYP